MTYIMFLPIEYYNAMPIFGGPIRAGSGFCNIKALAAPLSVIIRWGFELYTFLCNTVLQISYIM